MEKNFWAFSFLLSGLLVLGAVGMVFGQQGKQLKPYAKLMKPDVKVGDAAPDFTLKSEDKKNVVTLSKLFAEKPVALIFGSYT